MTALHQPVVVEYQGNRWAVICDACSQIARDYTYPCNIPQRAAEFPPRFLIAAPIPCPSGDGSAL